MGLSSSQFVHARHCHGADCQHDPRKTPPTSRCPGRWRWARWLAAGLILWQTVIGAEAETIRLATFNVALKRKGPGLLLRDIRAGKDAQINAIAKIIARVSPDILLLTAFDYDLNNIALKAFTKKLKKAGASYPYIFALRPNTGLRSGQDLNGDGRLGTASDAQGFGRFSGQGGMALLSRLPIERNKVQDFSALKWVDFPDAMLPKARNGGPFPNLQAQQAQRLSTTGHWVVPVRLRDGGILSIMAFYATTPVFDGPEDRNGKRNHDEIRLWQSYLDGKLAGPVASAPFAVLGDSNLDPKDGNGRLGAMRALLSDPRLRDPQPASRGGAEATRLQGGVNSGQTGDAALDTADWPDAKGPGNLRVDYVLPSADLKVLASGVFWPRVGAPLHDAAKIASRHHLVWVDIAR